MRQSSEKFLVAGSALDGVMIKPLEPHSDIRGTFAEVFQEYWNGPIHPTQWSVVRSASNVLRGPHLHLHHDEYFSTITGKALVGLRDIRPNSPTRNRFCLIEVTADNPVAVLFPRGLLHGWYFPEETVHLQAVSESYKDYHAHDNLGCRWSDPRLEIPWPCSDPIISEQADQFWEFDALLKHIGWD